MLLFVLGQNPSVGGFFAKVWRMEFAPEDSERRVSFRLALDEADFSAAAKNVNITIESQEFSGRAGDSTFSAQKAVVSRFEGTIAVNKTLAIKGSFGSARVDGVLFVGKDIDAAGSFSSAVMDNLQTDRLQLKGPGRISVEGAELIFGNETVVLEKPAGKFTLGSTAAIEGRAKRIAIGDKFVIG